MLRVLYVSNKTLPRGDHRLVYKDLSHVCHMAYALPAKPSGVDESRFFLVRFGGGLRFSYVLELLKLLVLLRRRRAEFDCVHLNSTLLVLFGPLVARLAGLPSVVTITGFGRALMQRGGKGPLMKWLYLGLLSLAGTLTQGVFLQNRADLAWLQRRLPRLSPKLAYIGSGILASVVEDKCFTAPRLRVLLATRLIPEKGIDDFLTVAEHLADQGFEFMLAGPPVAGAGRLLVQVKACHARGLIQYDGELGSAALQSEYARSHVFYFPSCYGEGMARVMLECGFACLCPIAYDISANRELLAPGRGFLVPVGDTRQVEEILKRLATNRQLLQANALAYQRHITRSYSVQVFADRMDDVFAGMAAKMTTRTMPGARMNATSTPRSSRARPRQHGPGL